MCSLYTEHILRIKIPLSMAKKPIFKSPKTKNEYCSLFVEYTLDLF